MRLSLIWSHEARQDLFDIYIAIGSDNPSAADRIFDLIEDQVTLLVTHPRLGVRRPDIDPAVRMLVQGVYLILYETQPNTDEGPIDQVEIVRIVDGRRDLTSIF